MSLSVIPLTILGQITGVSGSGDTVLYQVSFKSIDGTPLYGVTAVWTDEQAEIEALAAQKPYGVWINPIDGTFTVKFAGYTYVGTADLTDPDVLAGITPIEFTLAEVSDRLLPEVTAEDANRLLQVNYQGEWSKSPPLDISTPQPYDERYMYLVTYTESGPSIGDAVGRVVKYNYLPSALDSAISNALAPQLTNLIQTKKWTVLNTSVTDEETYKLATFSGLVFVGRASPVYVSYQNARFSAFEFYQFIPTSPGGVIHLFVRLETDGTGSGVNATMFARYEE